MKILAAKKLFLFLIFISTFSSTYGQRIPVIDSANVSQTTITAIENVAQTLTLIDKYNTQLDQLANQLQNTKAPDDYLWDEADQIITKLTAAIDTLEKHKSELGSLDAYISRYQDVDYYNTVSCFNPGQKCLDADLKKLQDGRKQNAKAQKQANDAIFKTLDLQQSQLKQDAAQLKRLQASAQSAKGHMEALQAANQFASHQSNQLMQIRALMMAQQAAIGTKEAKDLDVESQQSAAHQAATAPLSSSRLLQNRPKWKP